ARGERPDRGARGEDGFRHLLFSKPVVVAAALGAFVYGPIVGYFAAFHGDWSYLYVVPWRRVPSAVDLLVVVLASSTIPLGVLVGIGPARAGRSGLLARLAAGPAVAAIVVLAIFARRLGASAT